MLLKHTSYNNCNLPSSLSHRLGVMRLVAKNVTLLPTAARPGGRQEEGYVIATIMRQAMNKRNIMPLNLCTQQEYWTLRHLANSAPWKLGTHRCRLCKEPKWPVPLSSHCSCNFNNCCQQQVTQIRDQAGVRSTPQVLPTFAQVHHQFPVWYELCATTVGDIGNLTRTYFRDVGEWFLKWWTRTRYYFLWLLTLSVSHIFSVHDDRQKEEANTIVHLTQVGLTVTTFTFTSTTNIVKQQDAAVQAIPKMETQNVSSSYQFTQYYAFFFELWKK